jgi:hypothetical protein
VSIEEPDRDDPPADAREALARAGEHARAALAEAAAASRCLLDAASLATTGVPADAHDALRRAAGWLDRAAAAGAGGGPPWLRAVSEALDAEIARWEARSHVDPEARAVLRAFLGVREVLWEFGLRPERPEPTERPAPPRAPAPPAGASRLQRIRVEG